LKLAASVGVNRSGQQTVANLTLGDTPSCLAELSATTGKEALYENLHEQSMARELEGKFCYLKPGGLSIFPLITSERTVGVLEIIGKFDDPSFRTQRDLFLTFAEHLTLALNAALMYESAEKRASHDALTGLANHKTIHEFLFARLAEARRLQQPLGVIMIDVDHFRAFNEEEGHDAGDTVLRLVSDAIRSCLRPYDLAARYGGEEFTVVIPNASADYVATVGERIRAKIESQTFITPSGQERAISASLGCACFPENQSEATELIKAADAALYKAKKAGRNRFVMWKGRFEVSENASRAEINLDDLIDTDLQTQSEHLLKRAEPEINFLVRKLGLSESQREILKALTKIAPTFRMLLEGEDQTRTAKFEADNRTRALMPSLNALEERYDGLGPRGLQGKKIPLLGRILSILVALGEDHGQALIDDPNRFDPEIVNLLADLSSA
ncbi:MAG: diguanylate cyclase, partial [Rhabdochlamydiaceae bacterium]